MYYWIGFMLYSFTVIGVGFYIWLRGKKVQSPQNNSDFWAAGGTLSGWSVGLSISASMMSISWSCVYGVQLFYWYGPGGAWLLIIPWLITMGGFYFFAPLFRSLKAFSQPELVEKKFGSRSRQILAVPLIFVFIVWTGAEIFAAGNIIAPFLGISVPLTLFLISLVVMIYSFTGGFEAVVSTDKIQFALVAIFITTIAYIGISASGVENLLDHHFMPPKGENGNLWFTPGLALILITFFAYLPGWLIETDVWVRLQAAGSDRKARKGAMIAGFNSFFFVGLMPLLTGLAALYLYPAVDGVIPERLQGGALIFTVLMQDFAPQWLSVFLSIGLIAAAMSTIDTCGNIVALSMSYDLLEPALSQKWNSAKMRLLARWMSVLAIFISFVYALFTDSLWDIFYLSSGVLTTTVFIPVIAAFRKNVKVQQVNFSAIFGFCGTILFYFLESRGILAGVQPQFIAETGIGFILYGFICGMVGFLFGKVK